MGLIYHMKNQIIKKYIKGFNYFFNLNYFTINKYKIILLIIYNP